MCLKLTKSRVLDSIRYCHINVMMQHFQVIKNHSSRGIKHQLAHRSRRYRLHAHLGVQGFKLLTMELQGVLAHFNLHAHRFSDGAGCLEHYRLLCVSCQRVCICKPNAKYLQVMCFDPEKWVDRRLKGVILDFRRFSPKVTV